MVDTALFFAIAFAGTGLPWISWAMGDFCAKLVMIALLLYATVWLPYVKKIQYEVEVVSPRFVPTAAVVFVLQGIWCVLCQDVVVLLSYS